MWSWVCECPLAFVFLVLFLLMIRTSVSSYQSHDFKGFVLQSFFFFFLIVCVSKFILHWKLGNCINNHIKTIQLLLSFATFLLSRPTEAVLEFE